MDHADQGSAISMMTWKCNLCFSLSAEMHTKRQGLIPVALLFPHSTYFNFWRHLTSMLWPWRGPISMSSAFQTMKRSPGKNSFFDIYFLGWTGLCSIWLCRISSASIFDHALYSFWEYRSPKNYIRIIKNLRRKSASKRHCSPPSIPVYTKRMQCAAGLFSETTFPAVIFHPIWIEKPMTYLSWTMKPDS